ncbi:MFS transporter [Thiotrichales bacterium 19S3-7]|nr:MFS transporter [Thiotrichales bacterium 19S3-7]MCF6802582.1 MFS transporter [Thiotrichales bacterium 19S3-11]
MLLTYHGKYQTYLSKAGLIVVSLFSLFYCFDYFLQISISVFLKQIKLEFYLTDFKLGLMGAVFFLSYIIVQMPGGYLIDRFGVKKITLSMLLCCCVGTLLMFIAKSFFVLLVARIFIGLGSSIAFLCAIRALIEWLPLQYFSFFVGVLQALLGLGAIMGQSPIAYLNQFYNWHEISIIFFLIAFTLFLLFLFVGATQNQTPYTSKSNRLKFFVLIRQLICDKSLLKLSLLSFIIWSPVASLAGFWLIPMFAFNYNIDAINASFVISFFWGGMVAGAIIIPLISSYIQKRKPVIVVAFILQLIALSLLVGMHLPEYALFSCLFILGFICPVQGFIIVVAKDLYNKENFSLLSGMLNMFAALSGGVMQLVVGGVLTYCFKNSIAHPYFWSFIPYLLLSVIGLYVSFFKLVESYPKA